MRQEVVEPRIVGQVAALGEFRREALQVGARDAAREKGDLEPVEAVEEIVAALDRAPPAFVDVLLALQSKESIDGRERRRGGRARGFRGRVLRAEREAPPGRRAALRAA